MFQFTLPRGERRWSSLSPVIACCFNSRSREGSDIVPSVKSEQVLVVSIHAPARGATAIALSSEIDTQVSIHAPARGATELHRAGLPNIQFQFTLPRGERRLYPALLSSSTCFNSRSREGSDCVIRRKFNYFNRFNSRSREGSDSVGKNITN